MDELEIHTPNKTDENFERLAVLSPNAVTETIGENGEVTRAIDKDVLIQKISCTMVDGNEERYQFTWPDKKKIVLLADTPLNRALRPCREESVNLDNAKNLYIEGDNLEMLKLLQKTYLDKIKMVYIGPPYSIGHDFVYGDDSSQSSNKYLSNSGQFDDAEDRLIANTESNGRFHTDWLNTVYLRLRFAKDLLTEDSVIFVSIGNNGQCNLVKLCNGMFGAENYIRPVAQNKWNAKNDAASIQKSHEFILVYRKSSNSINEGIVAILGRKVITYRNVYEDDGRFYYLNDPIAARGEGGTLNARSNLGYTVYYNPETKGKITVTDYNVTLTKTSNDEGEIYTTDNELFCKSYVAIHPPRVRGKPGCWTQALGKFNTQKDEIIITGKPNSYAIRRRAFVRKEDIVTVDGKMQYIASSMTNSGSVSNFSTDDGTSTLNTALGKNVAFSNPKNLEMIKYLIQFVANKLFIILDFFSGSVTTAHAVMQANAEGGRERRFIMVQISEETEDKSDAYKAGYRTICEIGRKRIRRAAKKIAEENPGAKFDNGFRILKYDTSNMRDVCYSPADFDMDLPNMMTGNIKEDRAPEALPLQVMLDLGIELSSKIEETTIAGKKVFDVASGLLIVYSNKDVNEEATKTIAQEQPYYLVMHDSFLAGDSVVTNFEQIFVTYSPDAVKKVL